MRAAARHVRYDCMKDEVTPSIGRCAGGAPCSREFGYDWKQPLERYDKARHDPGISSVCEQSATEHRFRPLPRGRDETIISELRRCTGYALVEQVVPAYCFEGHRADSRLMTCGCQYQIFDTS